MQRILIVLGLMALLCSTVLQTAASVSTQPALQASAREAHSGRADQQIKAERKGKHKNKHKKKHKKKRKKIKTPTCFGRAATIDDHEGGIAGTAGDDVIIGDDGENLIASGGGIDRICSGGGDDRVPLRRVRR